MSDIQEKSKTKFRQKVLEIVKNIPKDGTFGNYNRGGVKAKEKILRTEGAIK